MLRKHIAVDLGTANTLVFVQSQGIVINEPSVVAVDTINERVIAVGKEAKDYIGKTPQRISTIRPLRDGVIADFDAAQALIATFLKKVIGSWLIKPMWSSVCRQTSRMWSAVPWPKRLQRPEPAT